jgi:HSP20 family protein
MFSMRDLIPWSREGQDWLSGRGRDHPLMVMQRELDRAVTEMWRGMEWPFGRTERALGFVSPRIDVRETEKEIVVTAELPGLDEKEIEINLSDEWLTLRGEKRSEEERLGAGFTYSERSFGAFERRIPVRGEILADKVEAAFRNGVLTITLPRNPEAEKHMRRIPIGSGEAPSGGKDTAQKAA